VQLIVSAGKAFLGALIGAIAAMCVTNLFTSHVILPWAAVGIALGVALASSIRSWRSLSSTSSAVLVGVLAAAGYAFGAWFSAHP
jgi:hypothetical protein